MAPSAAPFEPSYTALKSLRQKISNYTTTFITLFHQPENLSTDLHPYLNNAIVTLSTLTVYLYNNNAPQAIRVVKIKKRVKRVNTKLNNIKTTFKAQIDKAKVQVNEVNKKVNKVDKKINKVNKKVNEVNKKVDEVDKKVNKVKIDIADIKTEIKLLKNYLES